MVEVPLDGRTRTMFVDCECQPKPESRQSPRFDSVRFNIRHGMRGDCRDYRSDLARFPGDPQAYVDGPSSLKKLIDQRKREGWQFHDSFQQALGPGPQPSKTPEQMAREAFERARDKGFETKE